MLGLNPPNWGSKLPSSWLFGRDFSHISHSLFSIRPFTFLKHWHILSESLLYPPPTGPASAYIACVQGPTTRAQCFELSTIISLTRTLRRKANGIMKLCVGRGETAHMLALSSHLPCLHTQNHFITEPKFTCNTWALSKKASTG